MQYAPTFFTTMLSFLRGNANFFICVDAYGYGAKQHCLQLSKNSRVDCCASAQRFKRAEAVLLQAHHILIRKKGRHYVIWKNVTTALDFNGFS